MEIPFYQVDAFTDKLFSGNPAGVCPLNEWLTDIQMQEIAAENNLSETAFFVPENDGYRIRWFTPKVEVDLCGHATLAAGHVIFSHLNYPENIISLESRSGLLTVKRDQEYLILDFPVADFHRVDPPEKLIKALGKNPLEVYCSDDYLVLFGSEKDIISLQPHFQQLSHLDIRGIIVTAPGKDTDFVSRFFAPAVGIDEDPVTGSAHTMLTPFWSQKLNKSELTALQLSERKGKLICKYLGNRVEIYGKAITYMMGTIYLDS
ncbi:MAG: isomerase [Bacteroides sp. SM23_62_1]|nr:MAG: isomerase [Bacteroides sp. SM23_62_1]